MNTAAGQVAMDAAIHLRTKATRQPLVVIVATFCAGICLDRWWPQSAWLWWGISLVALAAWCVAWRRHSQRTACLCLLLAIGLAAAAWHHHAYRLYGEDDLGRFARLGSAPTCLRVRAARLPERVPAASTTAMRSMPSYDRSRLVVEIEGIRDRDRWLPASGRTTLMVEGHLLGIEPGDQLQVFAQLSQPPPASNPGEFEFREHLRRQRQTSQLFASYPDCVTRRGTSSSRGLAEAIADIRGRGERMLFENIDRSVAGLASALLLGERSAIPRETTEAFVQTGTVHLLAISGLHVGILTGTLLLVLRIGWLPQRPVLLAVMSLTIAYAFLADARPSVVRATIMVVVFCVSLYLRRPAIRFNTLAAAGLIVLTFQPLELFSMGTQLSFLAVGTLICIAPTFARWQQQDTLTRLVESTRPWPIRSLRWCGRWYWRATLAGLAIWLVALPLLMYRIHLVSPAGALTTPLLYLPLALALVSGLGVLVLGWLAPPLAGGLGKLCESSIALLDWGVMQIRELPGSFFWVAGPELWWVAVFYSGVVAWAIVPRFRPPRRWCLAALGLWIAIGFAWPHLSKTPNQLRCTFVDVGHGCSVAIELPDDRVMLYDAGRLASPHGAARSIAAYLWSRGRTHIDAIVISHADVDHYNGVPELLERFSVGVIYVSPVMLEAAQQPDADRAVRELFRAIEMAKVPVRTLQAGQRLASDDVEIELLHPTEQGVLAPDMRRSDNANSLVLAMEYAGRRILLPGDLESPGAEDLMAEEPWDCDVLLAPHHGSPRSNPPGFAAWCQPEWTVVSGGRKANLAAIHAAFGPPNSPTGHVLHTAKQGAVTVVVTRDVPDQTDQRPAPETLGHRPPGDGSKPNRGTLTVDWHLRKAVR